MSHDNHDHRHTHSHAHDHPHEHEHSHPHEHARDPSHEHAHSHPHADEHSHDHTHEKDHSPSPGSAMTLPEKAAKLLDHWIRHNNDHAATYREWADRMAGEGMAEAAALLVEAADICVQINDRFFRAAEKIRKSS